MGNCSGRIKAYGITKQEALNSLEAHIIKRWNVRYCTDKNNKLYIRPDEDKCYIYTRDIKVELKNPKVIYVAFVDFA